MGEKWHENFGLFPFLLFLHLTFNGQSASLSWCQATISDPRPILSFFSMELIFRELLVSYYGAPYLTRAWICNLQWLLASPAQSFSRESHGTHNYASLPQFCNSSYLEGQDPAVITP
jgi:hypothetical protein